MSSAGSSPCAPSWRRPLSGVAEICSRMSKLNNRFSFYMLMFCGVGTICNISFLAFGKWSV